VKTVVLTTSYPSYDGDPSGHFVETEARRLAARGNEVHVLAPLSASHLNAPLESLANLTVHRLPHGGALGWPGARARILANPLRALGLVQYGVRARALAADLMTRHSHERVHVIVHWAVPGMFMVPKSASSLRITSHGEDVRTLLHAPSILRNTIVQQACTRAQEWRFVSTSLYDSLHQGLDEPARNALARIHTIEPAPLQMPEALAPLAPLASVPSPARTRYVSVGRLIRSKRVDRAVRFIANKKDPNCELIIVGEGPERKALEALASGLKLNVHFVGLEPRVRALSWLASAEALLMTSEAEGLSTIEREAHALGIAVQYV
jgi:glycosyltransferase involved in cell wall biosynthesis